MSAHELSPERVVDGRFTVSLIVIPGGDTTTLRLFFRDTSTGRPLTMPVSYRVSVEDEKHSMPAVTSPDLTALNGVGEWKHRFPRGGLYDLSLYFSTAEKPDRLYRPDSWPLWIPDTPGSPPNASMVGFNDIAVTMTLIGAAVFVMASVVWKRAKGSALELSLFQYKGSVYHASEKARKRKHDDKPRV